MKKTGKPYLHYSHLTKALLYLIINIFIASSFADPTGEEGTIEYQFDDKDNEGENYFFKLNHRPRHNQFDRTVKDIFVTVALRFPYVNETSEQKLCITGYTSFDFEGINKNVFKNCATKLTSANLETFLDFTTKKIEGYNKHPDWLSIKNAYHKRTDTIRSALGEQINQ